MSLKNSWHTELAIGILINDEETLDAKLNMLTEISLASTNEETTALCEKFRERLCNQEMEKGRKELVSGPEAKRIYKRDMREEESNEMDEGK